jgi:glycosyltransferase involved in cell wall biosynthesis
LIQLVSYLYRTGLKYNSVVFFQNPDDLQLFIEKRIIPKNVKPVLINGSGVNTVRFGFASPKLTPITFLLVARMIRDKGIPEYVEAARQLKKRYSEVKVQLLGPLDVNPAAITRKEIEHWSDEGIIEYLGETKDVRPYIAEASVFVLPSYREGTPRSVLEALSMGRPVITTDAPGCRETVQEGVNGYLVPIKDHTALFKAMERFVLQPELIPEFGLASRKIAEQKYDVRKVNSTILEEMELIESEALQKISAGEEGNLSEG